MRILLTLGWLALAVLFAWNARSAAHEGEEHERVRVSAADIDPSPRRTPLGEPPMVAIGGVSQRCSDCHAIFASLEETPAQVRQHTHVVMNHGINARCYNCHDREERNRLVLHDGSRIAFPESATLCQQCHGTLYRDWERGVHGRATGSWDRASTERGRLTCVECHDPHAPAFGPIATLPGPTRPHGHGPDAAHGAHEGPSEAQLANPLERWKALRGQSPAQGPGGPRHAPSPNAETPHEDAP